MGNPWKPRVSGDFFRFFVLKYLLGRTPFTQKMLKLNIPLGLGYEWGIIGLYRHKPEMKNRTYRNIFPLYSMHSIIQIIIRI